jgi:hypothetical protein
MTTITTTAAKGLADRIAEAFPEEYVAGLDRMDEEDAQALAFAPTMGARFTEALADPTAEADYGEVLDRLCEDFGYEDLQLTDGHADEVWLPEEAYSAAVWEAESPYMCRAGDILYFVGGMSAEKTEAA